MATPNPVDVPITNAWTLVLAGAGVVGLREQVGVLLSKGTSAPTTDAGAMPLFVTSPLNHTDTTVNIYGRTTTDGMTTSLPVWAV